MVRIHDRFDPAFHGKLIVEKGSKDFADVFYAPPPARVAMSGIDPETASILRTKLLEIDGAASSLTIFPKNRLPSHSKFLKSKYRKVKRITLESAELAYIVTESPTRLSQGSLIRTPFFGPTEPLTPDQLQDFRDVNGTVPSTPREVMEVLEELPYHFGMRSICRLQNSPEQSFKHKIRSIVLPV